MSTATLIRVIDPLPLMAIVLVTPVASASGIASCGEAEPEALPPTTGADPTVKVICCPGTPMSEIDSPESRPSHSRECGFDVDDSAVPASTPNRSAPSPWLAFDSRSVRPSACSRAHW